MVRLLIALAAMLVTSAAGAALNLNTATKDELVALPGIGPAKAQAIVDYRNQHGPFRSVDEVRKVKGIGEKLFNQIRPELSVTTQKPPASVAKLEAKPDAKTAAKPVSGTIAAKDDKPRK
jgi:competence protein ComEA